MTFPQEAMKTYENTQETQPWLAVFAVLGVDTRVILGGRSSVWKNPHHNWNQETAL